MLHEIMEKTVQFRRMSQLIGGLLAVLAPLAQAGPAARQSVGALATASDAIVAGSIEGSSAAGDINVTVRTELVLKGPVREGDILSLVWTPPYTSPPPAAWSATGHGLIFLDRTPSGGWTLNPVGQGDIAWQDTYFPTPAAGGAAPGGQGGANFGDIRHNAEASLPANPSVLDRVLLELAVAVEARAPVPVDLVSEFRQSHSSVLTAAFGRYRSSQDPFLRGMGIRGALAAGDASGLQTVHQNYAALAAGKGWVPIVQEIKIYYSNAAPAAVQELGTIATDSNVGADLRVAAASALARMHTRQTLPFLGQLLGMDPISLRAAAVGGLSSFANNVPVGLHEPASGPWQYRTDDTISHSVFDNAAFASREAYYLEFWKSWWQQNQGALMR
jgi:hypothetical protein